MQTFSKLLYLFVFVLIASCANLVSLTQDLSGENDLIQLNIPEGINDISINGSTEINDDEVRIFLPPETNTANLIPEFKVSKNSVLLVDGNEIKSGETALDFSENFTLTVRAENGDLKEYKIITEADFNRMDNEIYSFMEQLQAPGAQVAILKDVRLVYLKSYGFADTENKIQIKNNSLFRIASISKPITAVAVLKLVDEGYIQLDQKVFGEEGLLGLQYGITPYPQDIKKITIQHLLDHRSGWENSPYDPMFRNIDWTFQQLISDMIDSRALAYEPGTETHYLNFGYLLLGRIIEEVTDKDYEEFVNETLLKPAGIDDMKIAGNTMEERYDQEVIYYGQESLSPYAMNVTRMDAHGGWLASAENLMKFMRLIDKKDGVEDVVNEKNLSKMYLGDNEWFHTGSLPGTSSVIAKIDSEFSYAFIVNSRKRDYDLTRDQMKEIVQNEVEIRKYWPKYDLFNRD